MTRTTVTTIDDIGDANVIYVGRRMPRHHLPEVRIGSPFGNPYRAGKDGTLAEILARYRAYVLSRPDLLALLPTLRGKKLACWCLNDTRPDLASPDQLICHGQVLARLADGVDKGEQR